MADPKTTPLPLAATDEPVEKKYYLVNPKGCIHIVSHHDMQTRLKQVGYRKASADEVAAYEKAKGNQRWDKPLAKPHTTDPDAA